MRYQSCKAKNEQGTAMIATLMFLMAMAVLSTALVFTVQNEMKASTAYKYSQQALSVANAGVQNAIQWYAGSYNPWVPATGYDLTTSPVQVGGNPVQLAGQTSTSSNYPSSETTTAFTSALSNISLQANTNNSGSYALNATLLKYRPASFINTATFLTYPSAIERWRLDSIGNWGTNANNPLGIARITAIIENSGNALFDRALWGINSVDLGGTMEIDSYDPFLGPWNAATNSGDLGSIGSNGNVDVGGTADIHGDMAYGPTASYSIGGTASVTGDIIHLAAPRYFPPLPSFSVGTTDVSVNPSDTVSISPGDFGDITVKGTLTFAPGTYYIDELAVTAGGQIVISDRTTLFVKTSLQMEGQGVANTSWDPTRLTVNYAGTTQVKMTGGSEAYVEVYAPNAELQLNGNADFFGSFIAYDISVTGGPKVHFSEGCLQDHLLQRPFRLINWTQNTN
ncbi:MAG: pilus assembly PilX N-terminal domain-containing protein [Acidobacteria bacterium]|nr:pilus assembly PilX N-terminal domain-containing protein [Acidobacteriota bacterium]